MFIGISHGTEAVGSEPAAPYRTRSPENVFNPIRPIPSLAFPTSQEIYHFQFNIGFGFAWMYIETAIVSLLRREPFDTSLHAERSSLKSPLL